VGGTEGKAYTLARTRQKRIVLARRNNKKAFEKPAIGSSKALEKISRKN
jgi:hypothetical protein